MTDRTLNVHAPYDQTLLGTVPLDDEARCLSVLEASHALLEDRDRWLPKHAIARANAPDAYFQAAIFTQDLAVALRAHRRLRGMAVMVNDHTAFRVDWMPFGGHLSSGLGLGGIGYSMRDMSLERLFVVRSPDLP